MFDTDSSALIIDRARSTRLRELAEDLVALSPRDRFDVSAWMSRPSILRRVAALFASRLDADTDRIIALGPGAGVLGGAVALTSGVPFTSVGVDGAEFGEHHPGETAVIISAVGSAAEPAWIDELDVRRRLSAVRGLTGDYGYEALIP